MVEFEGQTQSVMTGDVHTVAPSCPAAEAAGRLLDAGIGSVIVEDDPHGVVTKTDLVAGLHDGINPETTPVVELMTPDPTTVSPDAPLREAVARMDEAGVKRLPVTDDGDVVGIVTTSDLVAAAAPESDPDAETTVGVFAATLTAAGVGVYECLRCGTRLSDESNPSGCPDCEGPLRSIGVARE
ncbi:rubrerythrin-like domain-containing protein [Halosegnis sp.]|uniref:rubrerythrin-like domain-containing protein n=1 Tax=Halosegnis sp. TaxID=2864959 RepID=UPI0035D4990D